MVGRFDSRFCPSGRGTGAGKGTKIGLLGPGSSSDSASSREILLKALHELGYIDGKNITIEYRYADNKVERLPALADELVRLKADVLVTTSTPAAIAAKNSTSRMLKKAC